MWGLRYWANRFWSKRYWSNGGEPILAQCFVGFESKIEAENTGLVSFIDPLNTGMESDISAVIGFSGIMIETLGTISSIDADNAGGTSIIDDSKTGMVSKLCQC